MAVPEGLGLGWFNALPAAEAERVLSSCCASRRWVEEVAAARPYVSKNHLYDTADEVVSRLEDADVDEALAGHPRIGERSAAETSEAAEVPGAIRAGGAVGAAWSRREQGGLSSATQETLTALAEGNRAYEERFGHVYLVCAAGKDADEMLALLHRRLDNDASTERHVLLAELAKINRVRLARLVEEGAA